MLTFNFWTEVRPLSVSGVSALVLVGIFLTCIVLSFFARRRARLLKKIDRLIAGFWRRVATATFMLGLFGLPLPFFSYEGIPLFSMRAWYLVWLFSALVWLVALLIYRFRKLPKIMSANHEIALKQGHFASGN
jgi:hypothetical protein